MLVCKKKDTDMKKYFVLSMVLVFTSTLCFAAKPKKFHINGIISGTKSRDNFQAFPKKLYFDGISFYTKGWYNFQTIRKTTGNIEGAISIFSSKIVPSVGSFSVDIQKFKSDRIVYLDAYAENMQEDLINNIPEYPGSTNKLKLDVSSSVEDANINGINAKYFDLQYKQGVNSSFQRVYCLKKDGYIITISTKSEATNVKQHLKQFAIILKTFTFESE